MDPAFLRHFCEVQVRLAEPRPPVTLETYLEQDPDMPIEVAEYRQQQMARRPSPRVSDYFAGVGSYEELGKMDDLELFARHLEAVDPDVRYRRHLEAVMRRYPEHREALEDVWDEKHSMWRFGVVGTLAEGDRAYVLFQHLEARVGTVPGYEPVPYVAVLLRRSHGWRIGHDPSPYSGLGMAFAPVRIVDSSGETVQLDLQ